ncbi:MAG: hypothetical protein JWM57_684 [Phycisphaerales bacterium]|nr:hypothetical protein [Phycisphaerales bacterium]
MWRASLVATVLVSSTYALADAQPATDRSAIPASSGPGPASSPYWNAGVTPTGQLGDTPAADIRAVPAARAVAVRTRWQFNQGLFDLNNATRLVRMTMDRQPDYVKAQADEKAAYDAMETARTAALADLNNNPAYVASEGLRANVSKMIADEQFAPKPDPIALEAMAKLKLQYVKDNRKLELAALERDSNFQDARKRYVEASRRVADYRDAQAIAIASDDTLQSLRKSVADARIEKLAAQAYFASSIVAQYNAVEYALRYRSVDIYHGYGNGGYAGYGGYGGGYGVGPYGVGFGGYGRY